jgi:hypothetical protein
MDNIPLILTGPSGCGKSYWIQNYAKQVGKQLFVCPCRKDRTLRDGRQTLHVWARRTEPAILWLEGVDDITPEAQAFLRRILETHATDVMFILECRDAGRLQEPIRSRCVMKRLMRPTWDHLATYLHTLAVSEDGMDTIRGYLDPSEYSYRRAQQCVGLLRDHPAIWEYTVTHRQAESEQIEKGLKAEEILEYVTAGYHPDRFIHATLKEWKAYGLCMEASGSLWAFLGYALDQAASDRAPTGSLRVEE